VRLFTIVLIFIFSFKVQALVDFKTCSKTNKMSSNTLISKHGVGFPYTD